MAFYTSPALTWYLAKQWSSPIGQQLRSLVTRSFPKIGQSKNWAVWATAVFLTSVPVFGQASLVRQMPWLSLLLTVGWLLLSWQLTKNPSTQIWGNLLFGFAGTWFTGSLYWGWLRWEPLLHLPVEALLVPIALIGLYYQYQKIGNWFYLGSLLGTAITDIYFYLTDLMPYWRKLMQTEINLAGPILSEALTKVSSPWGISWAIFWIIILLVIGIIPCRSGHLDKWAFSGAVLSTILVDSLFLIGACWAL